jgi:hypothetical protein
MIYDTIIIGQTQNDELWYNIGQALNDEIWYNVGHTLVNEIIMIQSRTNIEW